jgi:hypothetical protein
MAINKRKLDWLSHMNQYHQPDFNKILDEQRNKRHEEKQEHRNQEKALDEALKNVENVTYNDLNIICSMYLLGGRCSRK